MNTYYQDESVTLLVGDHELALTESEVAHLLRTVEDRLWWVEKRGGREYA